MLKNLLAKVGIGSAKIDTVVDNMTVTQGDTVTGTVHIQGGKIDQEINNITISVMTQAKGSRMVNGEEESYTSSKAVGSLRIDQAMTVAAGEKYEIPFSLTLPAETPITSIASGKNQSKVWLYTNLDIESGLDSGDRDYLTVQPHPAVEMMINKFLQNGFEYQKVDVEIGHLRTSTFSSTSGIYQEVEMRPSGGFTWDARSISEVELSFVVENDTVHLLVEVDRTFFGDGFTTVSYPLSVQESEITPYFEKVFSK